MRSLSVALLMVVAGVAGVPGCSAITVVEAHEIGKTQVTARFDATGSYEIDVTVDPDALLMELEAFAGGAQPAARPQVTARVARDHQIVALQDVFLDRVSIWFDEKRASPRFEYQPANALNDMAQAPSLVRLTGRVPPGTSEFSFANGLAIGTYALNVRIGGSPIQTFWLNGAARGTAVSLLAPPPPPGWWDVVLQYFALGYTHILPKGADHILFVLGIFLLSTRWRSILVQVSTFTLAHSMTLGLTMYGLVSMPARAVEPLIALSIAYVAVENLFTSELKPWRLALVFSFGLLHGMGFAGVLRDLGLPRSQFLTALLTFNAGVEAGQLSVIAIAAATVAYWRKRPWAYRRFIIQPASVAIAAAGVFWTIQRVL